MTRSITRLVFATLAIAVLTGSAATQSRAGGALAAIPPSGSEGGGFELLGAGDRKIALALFDAQGRAIGNDVAWTLDDIADAKQSGVPWSKLFARMRAEGLIQSPNLGSVISSAVRKWNAPAEIKGAAGNRAPVARRGAFKTLSDADRHIGEILFDNQTIGKKGHHAWSLDQIGTARQNGVAWAEIMRRMRSDGLIHARTVDDVMRRHARLAAPVEPSARKVVVTTGEGRQVVLTTRSRQWVR